VGPGAPRLVPGPPTSAPVAAGCRPLPDLGIGGPAAADPGRPGPPVLRALHHPVSRYSVARARPPLRRAETLGGGRILRAGAPPSRRRTNAGTGPRGPGPGHRRRAASAPRCRPLHRERDRGAGVRPPRTGARGERPAGGRATDGGVRRCTNDRGPRPAGVAADFGATSRPGRGVQRSAHGTRGDGVRAAAPPMPRVSDRLILSGPAGAAGPGGPPYPGPPACRAARTGRGDRPGTRGTVAGPASARRGTARRPLGVPGREDPPERSCGNRSAAGAARRDGPCRAGAPTCRHGPPRVQPFHRRPRGVSRRTGPRP
jgi:hypothetical protein